MTATTLSNLSIPVGKQSRISVIVTKNIPKTSSTNIGTLNELFDFLLNSLCHANSTRLTGLGAGCILAQQTTAGLFVDIHSPIHSCIALSYTLWPVWESHPHRPVIYYLCDERIPPGLLADVSTDKNLGGGMSVGY